MNEAINVWNTHRIRPTKNENVPAGRPCILYAVPEVEGSKDYSEHVDEDVLGVCKSECVFNKNVPADSDMEDLFKILMEENDIAIPKTVDEACNVYVLLRRLASNELYI